MSTTTVTAGGVSAEISTDGYRKGNALTGDGPWREVVYRVAWDDSDAFMDGLLGIGTASGGVGGAFTYPQPHRYPGNENLVCHEVYADPVGPIRPDTKLVAATYAMVHAVYRSPRWDIDGSEAAHAFGGQPMPFCRDSVRGFTSNYQFKPSAVKFTTGSPMTRPFEVLVPHIEMRRERSQIPYLNLPLLTGLVGKVNDAAFWGMDRGTLRFDNFDTDREKTTDGTTVQTLTMQFVWRPVDWNYVPAEDGIDWVLVEDPADNTVNPYVYADLRPLFLI